MGEMLARLLKAGVILAFSVVSGGGIMFLYHHGRAEPALHVFQGEPGYLRTVPGILQAGREWRGRAIIQLGILLMIFTPVVRVAFSLAMFIQQCDRTYAILTLIVLVVLLHSFLIVF
jgi:uncharacterized membrane protein